MAGGAWRVPALPEIVGFDLVRLAAGTWQAQHRHDFHEVHYVVRGRGTLDVGARAVGIGPGSVYLLLPGEPHGGRLVAEDDGEVLWVGVRFPPGVAVARGEPSRPFFPVGVAAAELGAALRALALLLARTARDGAAIAPSESLGPLLRVLAAMVEPVRQLSAAPPRSHRLADQALRRLESSPARPPTLAALAAQLGVSAGHLGESLARATGSTWPDLVAAQRLRLARALLADAALPVREVARRVGLSDSRALARLVRRLTGRSPRDLRG